MPGKRTVSSCGCPEESWWNSCRRRWLLLEFEPYDESRAELYQASWDLAEEEIVVVNGQALFGADAHSWETEDLPLPALEQVDWTIRTEDGLRQTRLSMGQNPDYDIVSFYAEGQGEPTDQIHGRTGSRSPEP